MKKIISAFIVLLTYSTNAQMHLVWKSDVASLNFLKPEKRLAVISDMSKLIHAKGFHDESAYFFKSLKEYFEYNFNEEAKGKLVSVDSSGTDSANYFMKITFLEYEIVKVEYVPTMGANGMPGSSGCMSEYVKAKYLIEIIKKESMAVVASLSLSNLTNKYPMTSTCKQDINYSYDIRKEITRSMIRVGNETAKYVLKMRKK